MKNIILILIFYVLSLSLVSCSQSKSNKTIVGSSSSAPSTGSSSSGSTSSTSSSSGGSSSSSSTSSSSGSSTSSSSSSSGGPSSVVATLSGEPSSHSNSTSLNITVAGSGVVAYQFKVGDGTTDCSAEAGYSSDVLVATAITTSISAIADGSVILCVIGKDSGAAYQATASATSATWTKDTTAPSKPSALSLLSPTTSPNIISQPTITISGVATEDTVKLYKNDDTCAVGNLVATGTVAVAQTTVELQVGSALSDGSYTFYATSTDPSGNTLGCSTANVAYVLDTVAPTTPTSVTLNAEFTASTVSPTITWTASTDIGGSGVASYKAQIYDSTNATIGSLTTLASGGAFSGLSLDSGKYYVKVTSYDNAGNASSASAASAFWVVCPTNYVYVPGLSPFTSSGFCAMKYGAANSSSVGVSDPTLTPEVGLNLADSTARCTANTPSGKYDLITNQEYMSIARNIEAQPSNWSTGTVGSGFISHGVNNQNPSEPCKGNDGIYGSNWGAGCSGSGTFFFLRTQNLSNGQVIFDMGGNLYTWVKGNVTTPSGSTGISDTFVSNMTSPISLTLDNGQSGTYMDVFGTGISTTSCNNVGANYCGFGYTQVNWNAGGIFRGGYYGDGSPNGGLFTAFLWGGVTYTSSQLGYRCVFHP